MDLSRAVELSGPNPVTATPEEAAYAYGWVVQINHKTPTGTHPRFYGPFGDEDAAALWMVNNGPEKTMFTILPIFDRIW